MGCIRSCSCRWGHQRTTACSCPGCCAAARKGWVRRRLRLGNPQQIAWRKQQQQRRRWPLAWQAQEEQLSRRSCRRCLLTMAPRRPAFSTPRWPFASPRWPHTSTLSQHSSCQEGPSRRRWRPSTRRCISITRSSRSSTRQRTQRRRSHKSTCTTMRRQCQARHGKIGRGLLLAASASRPLQGRRLDHSRLGNPRHGPRCLCQPAWQTPPHQQLALRL